MVIANQNICKIATQMESTPWYCDNIVAPVIPIPIGQTDIRYKLT